MLPNFERKHVQLRCVLNFWVAPYAASCLNTHEDLRFTIEATILVGNFPSIKERHNMGNNKATIVYLQYQRGNRKKASIFSILMTRKNLVLGGFTASFALTSTVTRRCRKNMKNATLFYYLTYKLDIRCVQIRHTILTYGLYKFETVQNSFIQI